MMPPTAAAMTSHRRGRPFSATRGSFSGGGAGSMRDWVYGGFAQNDHVHFTSTGYRRLSAVLFGDLMQQFETYRKSHERAE